MLIEGTVYLEEPDAIEGNPERVRLMSDPDVLADEEITAQAH